MTKGYACYKGLQAAEAHHGPARLLHPLKRQPDGSHKEIGSEQALDEIAARMRLILNEHGPEAVALYTGTMGNTISTYPISLSLMEAIGSPQIYSNLTIDQSAKVVAFERMGAWMAGLQDMSQSDVLLFFGANPLLSHVTVPVIGPDPARRLKAAKSRGMKLICIDPRRTETAHHADMFLQPVPGMDATIAAGLIRVILANGWEDKEFCTRTVGHDRIAALRTAVEPFEPGLVERHARLQPGQVEAAARLFALECRRGAAYASTGPSMAPFSNLMQHFVETLNVICGRFRRAGDPVIVDMIAPEYPVYAEVVPAPRSWARVPPSRIRGVGILGGERLTGTLADEILTPGTAQIRCMIVYGGNPISSVPDQKRMVDAMCSLGLSIVIDAYMTNTGRLADYVLPPRMCYERADVPISVPGYPLYPDNWAQYAPAIISPPPGSDVVDDWYVFWSIAQRLGLALEYDGVALNMEERPTTEVLHAIRLRNARISLDDLKNYPSGAIFAVPSAVVQPRREGHDAKFDIMPDDVAGETSDLLASLQRNPLAGRDGTTFTHLLSTRRMRDVFNTNGNQLSAILRRTPFNPAYFNSADLEAMQIGVGDNIEVRSEHGFIEAVADRDDAVRQGVVSISHCWGGLPDEGTGPGVNVNLLISCSDHFEPINAMPRMSAVPVLIRKLSSPEVLEYDR